MKERQERLADVKIKTSGPIAEVFIDGRKVPRVMAFQAEMNTMEKRIAQVTLRVQCNLDLETGIVPELPEPWCWYYKPKHEGFCDPRDSSRKDTAARQDSSTTDTCEGMDSAETDNQP